MQKGGMIINERTKAYWRLNSEAKKGSSQSYTLKAAIHKGFWS